MSEQLIKTLCDYQMIGMIIPKDTILTYVDSEKRGQSKYKDVNGNNYYFDNSELLFSNSFCNVNKEVGNV